MYNNAKIKNSVVNGIKKELANNSVPPVQDSSAIFIGNEAELKRCISFMTTCKVLCFSK